SRTSNCFAKVTSSFQVHRFRTVGKRFGLLPSDCAAASVNAAGLKKRLPGSFAFHGLNVSGLNTLANPAGLVELAYGAGPFQKFGRVRDPGCPSGVALE